jgi:hypothetical protein
MDTNKNDLVPELKERWREWSQLEPAIGEEQLRRNLLDRIPDRRPRPRARLALVAVAASLLAVLIGVESTRRPPSLPIVEGPTEIVHETGENVILVLREGAEPLYVLTEPPKETGENR